MKTLKQIQKKKVEEHILGYAYDLTEKQLNHISKVFQEAFKEWLQQKQPKHLQDEHTGTWDFYLNKKELLEELNEKWYLKF